MEFNHVPVLLNECIQGLNIKENGIYVDGTLGGGGHSIEIVKRLKNGKLIGIDQDICAINAAKKRLSDYSDKVIFVNDNFKNVKDIFKDIGIQNADGFIIDIGVSSFQLDEAERGFSYMQDAPLDMRMDTKNTLSAEYVVNNYSLDRLNNIIFEYGEERWAKRIAEFIVKQREIKRIQTTFELVDIIKKAIPKGVRKDGPHPAKRTFQAIRIEVNKELEVLKSAVDDMTELLYSKGRLCVITFHSLEDRIVKNAFKKQENPCTCPIEFPICVCGKKPKANIITKKPIIPSQEEIEFNHRSRSAKLRILEKK